MKKTVLIGASVVTVILLTLILIDNVKSCHYNYDGYETLCMKIFGNIEELLVPFVASFFLAPIILIFSIITYKMEGKIFRAWWNYASNWIVLIIFATFFFEIMGDGGSLNMGGSFEMLVVGIFYTIMIVGSLEKIVKTYQKTN